jgi:hypothetical protein
MGNVLALSKEKRAELELMNQARQAMNVALRKETEEILQSLVEFQAGTLQRVWDLGEKVQKILDNEAKYGANAFELLMAAVGYKRSYLQKAASFHRVFTEKQLKQILSLRMQDGDCLSWQYVDKVLSIPKAGDAIQLLKQACAQQWDPRQLDEAVDKYFNRNKSQRHAGGRPLAQPKTIEGCFSNFQKVTEIWLRRAKDTYLSDKFGFMHWVTDTPADRITPEVIAKIEADEKLLAQILQQADQLQKELRGAKETAQKRAQAHAKELAEGQAKQIEDKSSSGKKRGAQRPVGV